MSSPCSLTDTRRMITRIEALNFRCLRYVSRPLERFHVLVGPNASGKTTFLDVLGFVSRLLNDGLEAAIETVTPNPLDLLYGRMGSRFELAIEARVPESLKIEDAFELSGHDDVTIRYEVAVRLDGNAKAEIDWERVFVLPSVNKSSNAETDLARSANSVPTTLETPGPIPLLTVRREDSKTTFFSEDWLGDVETSGPMRSLRLSSDKSALAILLDDHSMNPASLWLKQFLMDGVSTLSIDGSQIRLPSPPRYKRKTNPSGLSMPWIVLGMSDEDRAEWIEHIQTALPEIVGIRPVIRDEDRHCYLMIQYEGLSEIPQWMISDGTLRLLALTLPAFADFYQGLLLIEEPENGLHPKALETVFQALSYMPDRQVLLTTHSPQLLSLAELPQILCFAKDSSGAVDIVSGDQHPSLRDWQRDISLGSLFAAGALE